MADENTAPKVNDIKVDESPISRPDPERRNSLAKQLSHRPDRAELIESEPPTSPIYTYTIASPALTTLLVSLRWLCVGVYITNRVPSSPPA